MKYLKRATVLAMICLSVRLVTAQSNTGSNRQGASPPVQRRLALVIGNNTYRTAALVNAVTDAVSITGALKDLDFEVTGLTNLGLPEMERAIDEFASRLTPADVAVFFYAGHGVEVEGENYLVPIDFAGVDEADLKSKSYSASRLHEKLQKAAVKILILDACRDNPFRGTRSASRGLGAMDAHGSLIAFATGPGSTAADSGAAGRNGLFTEQLLTLLKQPGMTANELFRTVRVRVNSLSGGKQTPWLNDGLLGDFIFNPGKDGTVAVKPTPLPLPQPPPLASARPPATAPNTTTPKPPSTNGRDLVLAGAGAAAASKGMLRLICDRNCAVFLNGDSVGILTAEQGMAYPVPLGQNLVKVTGDGVSWEQVVDVPSPVQVVVRTDLNSALEKIQEQQRLAMEQERQRLENERLEQERLQRLAEQQRQEEERRSEEARVAELQRQEQLARQREQEELRREAAARLFAAVEGTWIYIDDHQDDKTRILTEDVVTIDATCSGVLDRTVTRFVRGFSTRWRREGEPVKSRDALKCEGDGTVSGAITGRVVPGNDNKTISIAGVSYTRK